ncbi:hypothetical protein DIPPA_01764 [Diplonema papillatum]|nr:hypothetical protein DIPPA_01764 [Diplonema papillatum]
MSGRKRKREEHPALRHKKQARRDTWDDEWEKGAAGEDDAFRIYPEEPDQKRGTDVSHLRRQTEFDDTTPFGPQAVAEHREQLLKSAEKSRVQSAETIERLVTASGWKEVLGNPRGLTESSLRVLQELQQCAYPLARRPGALWGADAIFHATEQDYGRPEFQNFVRAHDEEDYQRYERVSAAEMYHGCDW